MSPSPPLQHYSCQCWGLCKANRPETELDLAGVLQQDRYPLPQAPSPPSGPLGLKVCTSVPTDVVVLEVSSSLAQPSLFYHLAVRESFSMTNNVLLCSQADLPDLQALRVGGRWLMGTDAGLG